MSEFQRIKFFVPGAPAITGCGPVAFAGMTFRFSRLAFVRIDA